MGEKIIIFSFSGIGNSLMAAPFLHQLKSIKKPAQFDCLCLNSAIAQSFDLVFDFNKKYLLRGNLIPLFLQLRRNKYDFSITLFPSNKWQFNLIAFLVGAKLRLTHKYNKDYLSFLQNKKIPAQSSLHDIDQNLRLLAAFISNPDYTENKIKIKLKPEDLDFTHNFLIRHNLHDESIVGIHAGAGTSWSKKWQGFAKRWPKEKWIKLCDKLTREQDAHVLLFGAGSEVSLNEDIRSQCQNKYKITVVKDITLSQAAALIEQCSRFIANDSGLMHIADSFDIKTIAIIGPTNPRRTGPRNKKSFCMVGQNNCRHCLQYPFHSTNSKIECDKNFACFNSITVEEVLKKVK